MKNKIACVLAYDICKDYLTKKNCDDSTIKLIEHSNPEKVDLFTSKLCFDSARQEPCIKERMAIFRKRVKIVDTGNMKNVMAA